MGQRGDGWKRRSDAWLDAHWIVFCAVGYPATVGLLVVVSLITGTSDPLGRALICGVVPFLGTMLRGLLGGSPSSRSLWDRLPGPSKNPDDPR
jgi:hypothetical protein